MDGSALKQTSVNDFNHFIEMKARAAQKDQQILHQAAKQFEALFLQNMLKSMRQANDFLSDDSPLKTKNTELFSEMLDQQLVLDISNNTQGIGLADMMIQQLDKSKQAAQFNNRDGQFNGINLPANNQSEWIEQLANRKVMVATPADFVKMLWPVAQKFAQELGVDPKVLIAQAAHETGWGKHVIKDDEGASSFNLFNIKASNKTPDQQVSATTTEYIDGVATTVNEPFRKYSSIHSSFEDYVSLIKNNKRYQNALDSASDPSAYMQALQNAGYATDPLYAKKVMAIYNGQTVGKFVPVVENK